MPNGFGNGFDWFTKSNVTAGSENIPTAFKHISSGAPSSVYLSMVANGDTFDEAMQDANNIPIQLDDAAMFDTPETDDPDALEKAIYQLNIAELKGIEPADVFETPYGPAISSGAIDALLDEYPALDSGIDLNLLNEGFDYVDRILTDNGPEIEAAMDAAMVRVEEEGNIEATGDIWKQLGDTLGNAVQAVVKRVVEGTFLSPKEAMAAEGDLKAVNDILKHTASTSANLFAAEPEDEEIFESGGAASELLGTDANPDPVLQEASPPDFEYDTIPQPLPSTGKQGYEPGGQGPDTFNDWVTVGDEERLPGRSWGTSTGAKAGRGRKPDTAAGARIFEIGLEATTEPPTDEPPFDPLVPLEPSTIERDPRTPLQKSLAEEPRYINLAKLILSPDEQTGNYLTPQGVIDEMNRPGFEMRGVDAGELILGLFEATDRWPFTPWDGIFSKEYRGGDVNELKALLVKFGEYEASGKGEELRLLGGITEEKTAEAKAIQEFKDLNPGTKLSNKQIVETIRRFEWFTEEYRDIATGLTMGDQAGMRAAYRAEFTAAQVLTDTQLDKYIKDEYTAYYEKGLEDQVKIEAYKAANLDTSLTNEEILDIVGDDPLSDDQKVEVDKKRSKDAEVPVTTADVPVVTTTDGVTVVTTTGAAPTPSETGDLLDPDVLETKEAGELSAEDLVTENLYSTFYRTVYAYPESGRSDVQKQLPFIQYDTRMLFFLWGGLDAFNTNQQAVGALTNDVRTQALDALSTNYRTFVEEYLRDPASKRSGQAFRDRVNIIATVLEQAAANPIRETWSDEFRSTHVWVDALFGPESPVGAENRSRLLKISASRGGRGYYSSLIHGAVDRAINYYRQIGWTPEQIFKRMSYLTNMPDDPLGETQIEGVANKVDPVDPFGVGGGVPGADVPPYDAEAVPGADQPWVDPSPEWVRQGSAVPGDAVQPYDVGAVPDVDIYQGTSGVDPYTDIIQHWEQISPQATARLMQGVEQGMTPEEAVAAQQADMMLEPPNDLFPR